ncbi:hypothetical protein EFR00_17585 [Rhizobium sophoriradicis]|uniref:hypothetical protein n=1 Tax=Rhizobium sophoriradicis TaxID=1535245 RepID=UPI0005804CB6|nr:hypothetical protein [Rhizobium sophoriradicis]AJC78274.1 hypothetical protein IE4803_CH01032 [Rhizobium etli bv. phaseoli str. IE4803]RSC01908.1 hypothetical protein EFR00_17585 [Rhizobium sophoriradicis]
MSADCIIKAFSGCPCPPNCVERRATPTPLTFVSWRIQALACIAFGFVIAIVSAAWMEPQLKHRDLANQEQISWR